MPSTLLLSAFDVPYNNCLPNPAVSPAVGDEDLNEWNLVSKNRFNLFQFSAAAVTNALRWDAGAAVTKAVDHLIIARADILKTAGVTSITLAGGSDGATFGTTAHTNASFASATLYGPRAHDYVTEISTTAALEWWRMTYAGSSSKFCQSGISFGQFFDFGVEVSAQPVIDRIPAKVGKFVADSGAEWQARQSEERYVFQFVWKKVTVAKGTTFMNTFARYAERMSFFLYTTTAGGRHELLDSQRLIHCRITSVDRQDEKYNRQTFTIGFEELIG